MAARRDPVHELEKKITGLMELTGFGSNFQGFCKAAKIKRAGLRSCREDTGTRGLNGDYQMALAAFAGFCLDWPEWNETDLVRLRNGQRRDTAQAFLDRCARELAGEPNKEQPDKERRLGLRLKSRHDGNKPWFEYDLLASVQLFAEHPDRGECRLAGRLNLPSSSDRGRQNCG